MLHTCRNAKIYNHPSCDRGNFVLLSPDPPPSLLVPAARLNARSTTIPRKPVPLSHGLSPIHSYFGVVGQGFIPVVREFLFFKFSARLIDPAVQVRTSGAVREGFSH